MDGNGKNGHLPAKSHGGFGDNLFTYDKTHAAELKLITRAIRNGWDIPQETKRKIVERAGMMVEFEADDDLFLKAAKLLLEADKADISRERNEIEESRPAGDRTTINYNRLSLDELVKLEELAQKAGVVNGEPVADGAGPGSDQDGQS